MATITYELGCPKLDKTRKVSIVLSHKGQRKRIPVNLSVAEKDITKNGKLKASDVKRILDVKLNSLRGKLYSLDSDKYFNIDSLYSQLTDRYDTLDFFEYTEQWIEKSRNKGRGNYRVMLNSVKKFYKHDALPFCRIDYRFLNDYKDSLALHPRAQSLYLGCMRHIFNEAIKEYNTDSRKCIPNNPFQSFSIPKDVPKTKDRVVCEDTLAKLFQFQGTGRAGLARDCYILSFCLIGMNSVDLYQCTSCHNNVLSYNRAKTMDRRADNAHIEIVVPDIVKPLFEKYKGQDRVFDFYKRYSNTSSFNKNINIGLHTVAETLNVPRFDFYSARHTWASIARNKLGIDKYTIHEALNHVSDLDITDIYIQKDYTNINKANTMVLEYVMKLVEKSV